LKLIKSKYKIYKLVLKEPPCDCT